MIDWQDSQSRVEEERVVARVDQLEQMVDDCGGAMDDIAVSLGCYLRIHYFLQYYSIL